MAIPEKPLTERDIRGGVTAIVEGFERTKIVETELAKRGGQMSEKEKQNFHREHAELRGMMKDVAITLLAGFLVDVNRAANALEEIRREL